MNEVALMMVGDVSLASLVLRALRHGLRVNKRECKDLLQIMASQRFGSFFEVEKTKRKIHIFICVVISNDYEIA